MLGLVSVCADSLHPVHSVRVGVSVCRHTMYTVLGLVSVCAETYTVIGLVSVCADRLQPVHSIRVGVSVCRQTVYSAQSFFLFIYFFF